MKFNLIKMKLISNEQKNLCIFVMLLILNSFSISICDPLYKNHVAELDILIEIRKESKEMLKKEYEYFKLKFEKPEFKQIQEFLERKSNYDRIYWGLSENIKNLKKLFLNFSAFENDIKIPAKPRFQAISYSYSKKQINFENLYNNPKLSNNINQGKYFQKKSQRFSFLNINQNSTNLYNMSKYLFKYGEKLREWEDKLNLIIAHLTQDPDYVNSLKQFKLKKIEEKLNIFSSNKTNMKNSDSLNFDDLMKDLDLSIKNYYIKIKYLHNKINKEDLTINKERSETIRKVYNQRNIFSGLKHKSDKLKLSLNTNNTFIKVSNEVLADDLFTKILNFAKKFELLKNLNSRKIYLKYLLLEYAKKRMKKLVGLFQEVIKLNYNHKDNSHKEIIKNYNNTDSYFELICQDILRFYTKLVLYLSNSKLKEVCFVKIENNLKYFPLVKKINKTEILQQNKNKLPTKDEVLKEMSNLKIAFQFLISTNISNLYQKNSFNYSSYEEIYEYIREQEKDTLYHMNTDYNQTNLINSIISDFNDIFSTLNNKYNDLINTTNEIRIKHFEIWDFLKGLNIYDSIRFLESEFKNNENNLNLIENDKKFYNTSFINMIEILKEDVGVIKNQISFLKQVAKKKYPELKKSSNFLFEILHNLKFNIRKPYLFNDSFDNNKTFSYIKNLNIFLKDLLDDIYNLFYTPYSSTDFLRKAENLPKEFTDEIKKFKSWKEFSNEISNNINRLDENIRSISYTKETYQSILKKEDNIDKKYFPEYYEYQKIRNENGVSTFMNFINNFFNSTKAQNILADLYEKLNPSKNKKSRLLRNERTSNSQYNKMRIWSSFRFEEALEKTIKIYKNLTLIDLLKISTITYISEMKPVKCWKDTLEERISKTFINTDKTSFIGPLKYHDCTDNLDNSNKDFCRLKCYENEIECDSFCSKTNCDSNSIKDFRFKSFHFLYNETYTWNDFINQRCPYGYVKCDDRSCAISEDFCDVRPPKITKKFVDAFANFMGYIHSMKEGKLFAWTDNSEKFNYTINELENFYFENKDVVDKYENFFLNSFDFGEYEKIYELLAYFGFGLKSEYVYLNESNKVFKYIFRNFAKSFSQTENDYETFINLRNKNSFGIFQNVVLNQTFLNNINDNQKNSDSNKFEPYLTVEKYMKLTIRIIKMTVIFKKPKCY
jgi:hypothetical protein